jgi:hypothetical protein
MPGRLTAVAIGVLLVAGCADDGSGQTTRRPVELDGDAQLTAPTRLQLGVLSCHGDPEVSRLSQGEQDVRIEVTARVSNPGDACMDLVTVDLDAPLGERAVVDLTSGKTLRIAS